MEITRTIDGDQLTVRLDGRLDTNTAPEAQAQIAPAMDGMKVIDIDLSGVDYVSSAGLRTLLFLHKEAGKQGASMYVLGCSPVIMDIFKMTGFDKTLQFRD